MQHAFLPGKFDIWMFLEKFKFTSVVDRTETLLRYHFHKRLNNLNMRVNIFFFFKWEFPKSFFIQLFKIVKAENFSAEYDPPCMMAF